MITGRKADSRARIGFTMIGGTVWAGGLNYLHTLLHAITHDLADRFSACLLVSPEEEEFARQRFDVLAGVQIVVDPRASGAGAGRRALSAWLSGRDVAFARLVREQHIDLMFESARFFGTRFPVAILSWIPDFQHRHLSQLFSGSAWWKRDLGFRAQCAGGRTVLLSSYSAEADCRAFYPAVRDRTRVARFVATLDIPSVVRRSASVRETYGLPDHFMFLPNQFWRHKNHRVVVDCLLHLKAKGMIDRVAPIVLSGHTHDPRSVSLFSDTMRALEADDVGGWFRHLGMIPYADVLALNAASHAVLNPSLFEGWSTTVEEAKVLGTPLVLSDIPIHREQATGALFFDLDSPQALAEILLDASAKPAPPRPSIEDLVRAHMERRAEFVAALREAFEAALGAGAPHEVLKNAPGS